MRVAVAISLFIGLEACQSLPNAPLQPALLTNPTPETRQELTVVISEILGGRTINISPDSFTKTSRLIIEPRSFSGSIGERIEDRGMRNIEHFTLMKRGANCYLYHEQSDVLQVLTSLRCVENLSQLVAR